MPPSATRTTAPMSNFFTPAPFIRSNRRSTEKTRHPDLDGDEEGPQHHRHGRRRRRRDLGGQAVADDEQDEAPESEEVEARQQRLERRPGRLGSEGAEVGGQNPPTLGFLDGDVRTAEQQRQG